MRNTGQDIRPRLMYTVRSGDPLEMDVEETVYATLKKKCVTCLVPRVQRESCKMGICALTGN